MKLIVGYFVLMPILCFSIVSAFTSFKSGDPGSGIFMSLVTVGILKGWESWVGSETQKEREIEQERLEKVQREYRERKQEEERQRAVKTENEKKRLLRALGTDDVNTLSGEEFERAVAHYLHRVGFEKIDMTPGSGDFGADLIIKHGGSTIVIQCKRWSETIGINAVQQVHSAKAYYRAKEAWVITSSTFSQSAKALAQKTGVRLFDLEDIKSERIKPW